jgi:hypothetical protein
MVVRPPRVSALLVLALCGLLAAGCSSATRKSEGEDRREGLRVETAEWDFGTLKRGETATRALEITNAGDDTLNVSTSSSCDCLTAEAGTRTLAPGETTRLVLSFLAEEVKDRVTKTAYVETGGAHATRLAITVTGRVEPGDGPHIVCLPSPLLFEKARTGFPVASLRVVNMGRAELEVTAIRGFGCDADAPAFNLGAGEEMDVEVSLVDGWTGVRWLEVDSNDPVYPTSRVPLVVLE